MADILLSNDDLTVFGGPETISLDLDFGPTGDRGSLIIGVQGDPRNSSVANSIVQDIQALDIAIDYSPSSSTYKTVFQYVATPSGTPQWTPLVSLKTNFYSETKGPLTPVSGKIVIAPETWFGPEAPQDWKHMYCKGWTILPTYFNNGLIQPT